MGLKIVLLVGLEKGLEFVLFVGLEVGLGEFFEVVLVTEFSVMIKVI